MIVGSLVLILVAVVLLVLGLMNGSSAMLIGSIGASLLAAVALVVGARQDTASRAGEGYLDDEPVDRVRRDGDDHFATTGSVADSYAMAGARAGRSGQRAGFGGAAAPPAPPAEPAPDFPTVTLPAQSTPSRDAPADPPGGSAPAAASGSGPGSASGPAQGSAQGSAGAEDDFDDEDPPDEPAPQVVSAADTARVGRLSVDVLVIDGRPRYHLPGCVHLLNRESEPLPASEAVELGFTPCSLCEPASALLTDPRRA